MSPACKEHNLLEVVVSSQNSWLKTPSKPKASRLLHIAPHITQYIADRPPPRYVEQLQFVVHFMQQMNRSPKEVFVELDVGFDAIAALLLKPPKAKERDLKKTGRGELSGASWLVK